MEQLSPNQYNKQNTDTDQDLIHPLILLLQANVMI